MAAAEIAALRKRIRDLEDSSDSPDPVVVVEQDGTVLQVIAWHGTHPPAVGGPLADAFEAASRRTVTEMLARGWLGASQRRLTLASGRTVSLSVAATGSRHRIAIHDVTNRDVLELAGEQRRRMRALSDLAGSLARELTDPMSIVQGRLELLLDLGVSEPSAVRRHLEVALDHARRVSATVSNLRLVGRTADPGQDSVPVCDVVSESLDLLGPRRDQVLLRIDPQDLAVGAERAVTARVLASLMRQALEAAGRSVIHLRARRLGTGVQVRIGPSGRPGEQVAVDGDELSLERTLLAIVGGELSARRVGVALQFEVMLPCAPIHRARRRGTRVRVVLVGRRVLLERVPSLLARDGFRFDTARTVPEALEVLQRAEPEAVDAVVAEVLLDGGDSGLAIAEWFEQSSMPRPRLVMVYEGSLPALPAPLVPLRWPMGRAELLDVLGSDRALPDRPRR